MENLLSRKLKRFLPGCKEIKDISKCLSFSRRSPRPFSLLSEYFDQSPSLRLWFLSVMSLAQASPPRPRLLCDPVYSAFACGYVIRILIQHSQNWTLTHPLRPDSLLASYQKKWYLIDPAAQTRNLVLILNCVIFNPFTFFFHLFLLVGS